MDHSLELVYIHWKDACTEEAAEPSTPVSDNPLADLREVGFLLKETADSVSIAMEVHHDGSPGRWRLHIPKVNIIEMRKVPLSKLFTRPRKKRETSGTTNA